MMKMSSDGKYKYYAAYCCKSVNGMGFGDMVIDSNQPLLLESLNDINGLKNYIMQVIAQESDEIPLAITIMDWRPLK